MEKTAQYLADVQRKRNGSEPGGKRKRKRTGSDSDERRKPKGDGSEPGERQKANRSASDDRRDPVATLHRTAGNQAVRSLYERGEIQASLRVSSPDDEHEREADRVARSVLETDEPKPAVDADREIQRKDSGGEATAVEGERKQRIQSVTSGGQPLPESTRSFFEPRFNRDFGDVRVHTGSKADEAARSINAEAFTHGSDIVFRSGAYQPDTREGKQLMAHELTHVVQSGGDGRSVHRSNDEELSDEDIENINELVPKMMEFLKSPAFKMEVKELVKMWFKRFDLSESEKEKFRKAVREERVDKFADSFSAWQKTLVTLIRTKILLKRTKKFLNSRDGFKPNKKVLNSLHEDAETLQKNLQSRMVTIRQMAMARLVSDELSTIEMIEYLKKLAEYLKGDNFRKKLENMKPDEQKGFVQKRLAVLSAMLPDKADETFRQVVGTLFKLKAPKILLSDKVVNRKKALEKALGGGDLPFKKILDNAIGGAGKTANIVKALNESLDNISGDKVTAGNWTKALDNLEGSKKGAKKAKKFIKKLDDSGKLGSFIAVTTLHGMKWPTSVEESINQGGNVAALLGTAPDIAKVANLIDDGVQMSKFAKLLGTLSDVMGPVGDFLGVVVDSINTYQAVAKGDPGEATGSFIAAGGAAVAIGMTIFGSTWWTGVGAIVGLGTALIGGAISYLFGEGSLETQLENMNLVKDIEWF